MDLPEERLSARLRAATREEHAAAENTLFMRSLIAGNFNLQSYLMLLTNLRGVYAALERAMRANRDHPAVKPVHFDILERTDSLDRDLEFLSAQQPCPPPSSSGKAYAARVEKIGSTSPHLLVSHAYVRYLGDLFGGQMLGAIVAKTLKLSPPQGVAFYRFDKVESAPGGIPAFRNRYREALDSLPLGKSQADEIVEEAKRAFGANIAVFNDLAGFLPSHETGLAE